MRPTTHLVNRPCLHATCRGRALRASHRIQGQTGHVSPPTAATAVARVTAAAATAVTTAAATFAASCLLLLSSPAASNAAALPSMSDEAQAVSQQLQAASPQLHRSGTVLSQLPPIPSSFPPLPEVKAPEPTEIVLPNGLRVFLVEDHEVPLVRGSLLMPGGRYYSPPGQSALASVAAAVQRAGGSVQHPGEQLDARLADLAAGVEVAAGNLALNADFSCMREDVQEVVQLFSEVLRSPALPADKLSLYQDQLHSLVSHQYDDPSSVAYRMLQQQLYGADSIYARQPTRAGVASITLEDVRSHLSAWERPDTAVLGVLGDFDSSEMERVVREALGDWQPAEAAAGAGPAAEAAAEAAAAAMPANGDALAGGTGRRVVVPGAGRAIPAWWAEAAPAAVAGNGGSGGGGGIGGGGVQADGGGRGDGADGLAGTSRLQSPLGKVFVVDRPGVTQATVALGEPGVSLFDRDSYALEVLSGMYNGFGGQLFNAIRSREGLAYSVSASWDLPLDHPGTLTALAQTSRPGELLSQLQRALSPNPPRAAPASASALSPAPPNQPLAIDSGTLDRVSQVSKPASAATTAATAAMDEPERVAAPTDASLSPSASSPSWPAPADVAAAKARLLNAWVFNSASKGAVLQRLLICELLGLPRDIMMQFQQGLKAVGPEQVLSAAQRHLHPDAQVVVVVGDGRQVEASLRASGFDQLAPLSLPVE